MPQEALAVHQMPIRNVIKDAPAQLVLGMLDDPLPLAYANVGLYVTPRQTGWRSLDDRTFRVSAVTQGAPANAPMITLEGSDVTREAEPTIPRTDAFVEIRQTVHNFGRY